MGFVVFIIAVLATVVIGQQAQLQGLDFYQSFFAVVVGLIALYVVAAAVFMAWMHLIFRH